MLWIVNIMSIWELELWGTKAKNINIGKATEI